MQEPRTVILGSTYEYRKSGAKRRLIEKQETFQYVPLIKNLEWVLQNKDLSTEVRFFVVIIVVQFMYSGF